MKKIVKWLFRIFIGLILFCLVASIFLFEKIDRSPYKESAYYKEMMAQLDTFQLDTTLQNGTYFKAGWAEKNITPNYFPDLAGYGIRDKATCLHDSVYVKTFVFDNGKNKSAFISIDLLIFPPILEKLLLARAAELGYNPNNFYFSATHTHSAPGGWAEGPASRLLAGSYKQEYVDYLLAAIIESIKSAEKNSEEAETGIGLFDGTNFVRNRLNMPDSKIEPWIRVFKIKKKSGAQAAIFVYSAHANCLKMNYTCISGDYPSIVIDRLKEAGKIDFAMYAAGMVGSHTPKPIKTATNEELGNEPYITIYGDSIAKKINEGIDSIKLTTSNLLSSKVLTLPLREPHLKISENWRVRPWVFKLLFGEYHPNLKILKINDVVFIGAPCDFSGELMFDFYALCKERKIKLVVTSFNGGYIGYINVDKYYDKDKAETRDMNWFGPYNQAYFTEIIQRILKKI